MISKLTFFETKDCENNRRGGWKNGYARILISNHDAFKKFYSKLHDTGLPIFKEFRDNWVPNNPIYSFRSGYLKSAFQIFDSIIVFNGICSYTKDNSKILTKYEEILKEIVL